MSLSGPLLLGDIGGTNARFLLAPAVGPLGAPTVFKTADFATLAAAIGAFLNGEGRPTLSAVALCVAGPVANGEVALTNFPWAVSEAELTLATGVARPVLVNDFTAAAMGVPSLSHGRRVQIGPCADGMPDMPLAVVGPGTGLGVSGLVPDGRGGFLVVTGEGGHVDLPAASARECEVLLHLLKGHVHVSAERAVSGPGLERLYRVLSELEGRKGERLPDAAEIAERARGGRDPRAVESVTLFTGWLGAVAGNVALTLGARGGVYIAGGVVPKLGTLFDADLFRHRFEAKGRFAPYLAEIPTFLVTAPDLALEGLRTLLAQRAA